MGLLKGIRRLAPLAAAGLAAGWFLKQQRRLGVGGGPEPSLPPEPPPPPPPSPEPAVSPDEPDEHDDEPLEAHAEAVEAVSDAADVTTVVEDLLAVAPGEEREIVDAEIVEGEDQPGLAEAVQAALADVPGLLSGSVQVEAAGGIVWLRGQLARPEMITEAERRAAMAPGVAEVRNLLHLPGTPPPTAP
jgi:BON domain